MLEQTVPAAARAAQDVTSGVVKIAEAGIRKAWSMLEAAAEKKSPSEYLSQRAIRSVQGN